jgi:hypothetical protein
MRFVKSISLDLFVCASAVAAAFERSTLLLFELSGAVACGGEAESLAEFALDCALAGRAIYTLVDSAMSVEMANLFMVVLVYSGLNEGSRRIPD